MIQRRSHRTAPRTRSLALGGALAALAVVGGGTVVAVSAPADVDAGDIRLAQNATEQGAEQDAAQEMPLGVAVNLDLEPVVARAAGGTIPSGTTVQVTGLPDGLTQDGWVISGTPTRAGEYDVLVTVSNSGVSKSQKVALTVTDGETTTAGDAEDGAETTIDATDAAPTTTPGTDAAPTTTPDADGEGADESDTTSGDGATTAPSITTGDQTDPTLSAVPGDPTQAGPSDEGAGDGVETDDDDEATSPDMCAVLGGGELDGASLAQLLPLVTGDDESASSGMVAVILNAVVSLLPSVLGDTGSMGDLGSAGEFLCTLSPELLGGGSGEGQVGDVETDGAGATTDGTATGGTTTDGTGAGMAGLDGVPSALLGMLTGGAGSTGQ